MCSDDVSLIIYTLFPSTITYSDVTLKIAVQDDVPGRC
jgi:hypothetical protein